MQPRLTVTDLACRRGDRLLFRGLSFALGPGEALQIAGANGTGKTSLLRIVAGLLRPFAGSVEGNRGAALLDHNLPLDEHQPLEKALEFWSRIDRCAYAETRMDGVGLGDLRSVPVRFLSAGQRKRSAYLLSNPWVAPIWLLDEPLNGLDAGFAATMIEDLEAYRSQEGIVVVASHQSIGLANLRSLDLADYAA